MGITRILKPVVWFGAFGYVLAWTAATWFVDDGGIVRDNLACSRLEEMPLFWQCDGFFLSLFANMVTVALGTTYLAPLAIAAALSNPALWAIALPIALSNFFGVAALVYVILRLVGWAVRGTTSYLRTGEIRLTD